MDLSYLPLGIMWWHLIHISKVYDRIWHMSPFCKSPPFWFPHSICLLLYSFLSDRSILVHAQPLPHFLSIVVFFKVLLYRLLFINDYLSWSSNSVHYFANDSVFNLLLILILISLLHLELRLNFSFQIFLFIRVEFPDGVASTLWNSNLKKKLNFSFPSLKHLQIFLSLSTALTFHLWKTFIFLIWT